LDGIDVADRGLDKGPGGDAGNGADDNKGGYEDMDDGVDEDSEEGSFNNNGAVEGSVENVGRDDVDGPVYGHPAPKSALVLLSPKLPPI